jgi:hypothetical protein
LGYGSAEGTGLWTLGLVTKPRFGHRIGEQRMVEKSSF